MDFIGTTPESSFPSFVDFVADRSLIEKYAKDPNASPSLPKLIDLILRQNLESLNEPYSRLMRCHRVDLDDRTFRTARRIRANKTLTLMLASAINWNLDKIERDMSITMQFCLVQDLMNTTFSGTSYCSSLPEPLDNPQDPSSQEMRLRHNQSRLLSSFVPVILQTLDDHCVFGLLTYARWILRAHIQRKIPKKAAKGGIVSFGNITDPDVLAGLDQQSQGHSLIWTLFRQISREKVGQTSVDLLECIAKLDKRSLRVPVPDSFVLPTNDQRMVEENTWGKGVVVNFLEFRIEILYDLAGYWLFEGKITQSAELLQRVNVLLLEMAPDAFTYCHMDMEKLGKMCRICGVAPLTAPSSELMIAAASPDLTPSMKARLLEVLLEDLPTGKISPASRHSLEMEILASDDSTEKAFLLRVRLCNLLREYVSGQAPSAMVLRSRLSEATAVDLDWFRGIINGQRLSTDLRTSIQDKLRFLSEKNLLPALAKTRLADVLTVKVAPPGIVVKTEPLSEEDVAPSGIAVKTEPLSEEDVDMKMAVKPEGIPLQVAARTLASACTYAALKQAVMQISEASPTTGVKDLLPTWSNKIPPGLESSFGRATWNAVQMDTVVGSFARAAEMAEEGCFRGAKQLLRCGRLDWQSYPKSDEKLEKKLERNFRWQNMYLDLMESQQQLSGRLWTEAVKAEADRRAKVCMKAVFFKAPDEEPVPSYVEDIAVLVLFNLDDWGFVKEVAQDQKRKSSSLTAVFPFLKQLNAATLEFQQQKDDLLIQFDGGKSRLKVTTRQECLKLWNVLASSLSRTEAPQSVLRRPGGAALPGGAIPADVLWPLLRSLRHKSSLYLLLSCFCRMWSLVNRDNRSLPTVADPLWPVSLPLHATITPVEIKAAMSNMVDITTANGMDDADISLLKGDFHFYQGAYEAAVAMYIRSFLGGSLPGFLHPATALAPSQTTLRKLVSCFESLRCHTYVAVLCQLTVPVDYDTAFRSVAEKVTHDAADEIYAFLWDPLILEHAAFSLQRYGFLEKRQVVMDLLQSPILNAANPPAVAQNVAAERAVEFFEVLFDQYVVC